jgi:hypothetical protein
MIKESHNFFLPPKIVHITYFSYDTSFSNNKKTIIDSSGKSFDQRQREKCDAQALCLFCGEPSYSFPWNSPGPPVSISAIFLGECPRSSSFRGEAWEERTVSHLYILVLYSFVNICPTPLELCPLLNSIVCQDVSLSPVKNMILIL